MNNSLQDHSLRTLAAHWHSMKKAAGVQKSRRIFSGAKQALLENPLLPPNERDGLLKMYHKVEKQVFGKVEPLPLEPKM